MAGFKNKKPKQKNEDPKERCVAKKENRNRRQVVNNLNPNMYYNMHPSWRFYKRDRNKWSLCAKESHGKPWDSIIEKLQSFETQTWSDILIASKKNNHFIEVSTLNKAAIKRISELKIDAEEILSLRFEGKIRLYGLMYDGVFNILWYDEDHGDNETCVCRSNKKHT